jgi:hypothetical protein
MKWRRRVLRHRLQPSALVPVPARERARLPKLEQL